MTHPGDRHAFAERLDNDIREASLAAEKTLKLFGEPEWSVALAQARKKRKLLSQLLSVIRTGLVIQESVIQGLRELDTSIEFPLTRQECSQKLRQAAAEVQTLVASSYARRDEERTRRLQHLDLSTHPIDRQKAKDLRHIKKAEDIKQVFKKLKYVRGKVNKRGITRIEIPLHPD